MKLKFPVMITLRQIRDASPREGWWDKLLAANGGSKADLDAELELASIIDSNDLDDCLWALQCKPEYQHIYRKFAVVCADEVSHLMTDERSTTALDVAWNHSCGKADDKQMAAARDAALDAALDTARDASWVAARVAARVAALDAARDAAWSAAWSAALTAALTAARDDARDDARAYQAKVLRHALTTGEVIRKCQNN